MTTIPTTQPDEAVPGLTNDDVVRWASHHRCVWVVSPRLDDEIVALGGLMAMLCAAGASLQIVSVTDGPAHSSDATVPSRHVALRRALNVLGIAAEVHRIGLPDGDVASRRADLTAFLSANLDADDLVLVPWRFDGHPDHEASARATLYSVREVGATAVEYPVWAASSTAAVPWRRARCFALDGEVVVRKERAIDQFNAQFDEAATSPTFVPPFEVVFC